MAPFLNGEQNGTQVFPDATGEALNKGLSYHNGLPEVMKDKSMPIAVVGMSFRGPADATNVENLWRMILEGREGWSKIPKERWNNDAFYHPDNTRHGTINVEGGHFFAEDLARFDAPFFNMTNAEAAALDPQQRLLLEGTFGALENAGLPLESVTGSKTSCFVGSFCGDYTDMLLRDPECVPMYQCTNAGQSRAITANRISYFFDLKGPSVTVDTACSGSLVALHLACQSLRTGDASMAIAAGVNTVLSHEFMSTMSMMKFLSPDGRCYTFDERANGYARGEGVGCLILKPLANALRDHDTIQGVIRGSGSNQDGRTSGITLPSGEAQEALIHDVYESAGLDPLETEFVEAHGTGTQAGDPIEAEALSRVFGVGRSSDSPLRIGSIKTNVGHMEGASGIGGVVKAVMMLQNRILLPNRNFQNLNPRIFLDEWKQKIQLTAEPWETPGSHRVSVNSFGYGGSNAHVVIEDAQGYLRSHGLHGQFKKVKPSQSLAKPSSPSNDHTGDPPNETQLVNGHNVSSEKVELEPQINGRTGIKPPQTTRLFTVSGFDESTCEGQIKQFRDYLESRPPSLVDEAFMDDLAYTLNERRTNFMWKAAIFGSSVADLANALAKVKPVRAIKKPVIGFVFTGQGAQWCGMGKELLDAYPIFSDVIDRITLYLRSLKAPFSVRDELTRDPNGSQINLALYSQAICSAVQIALIELLKSWGITPASVTGHSSGEIACAYVKGALSLEDAMSVAYYRGVAANEMQQLQRATGAMMAVGMTEAEAEPYLNSLSRGKAVIACINSPSSLTISGDEGAIDELKAQLDQQGTFARKLAVQVAYHSDHMKLVAPAYRSFIANIQPKAIITADDAAKKVEFFSSVTGVKIESKDLGPDYWVSNMVGKVKFADSVRSLCMETSDGKARTRKTRRRVGAATKVTVNLLIEIGPHSALAGPVKQILQADEKLKASPITYISALVRKNSAVTTLLQLAIKLFTSGYPTNFAAINRPRASAPTDGVHCLNDLPQYPWNHTKSYWAEPRVSKVYRNRKFPRTDLLGVPDRHASETEPRWRNYIRAQEIPWVRDHKIQSNIVYPAAGYLTMAIEAINQRISTQASHSLAGFTLRDVAIQSAMVLNEQTPLEVMVSLWPHEAGVADSISKWHEFRVASISDSNKWTQHCSGLVAVKYDLEQKENAPCQREQALETQRLQSLFAKADCECNTVVDVARFYSHLTNVGLEYGETFAKMSAARSTTGSCLAKVTVSDTAATMPKNFEYPSVIHPSTLDSILHPIFVAMSADSKLLNPAIPVSIEELNISCGLDTTAGHQLDVVAFASHKDQKNITADIVVVNDVADPKINLSIRGLICRVLEDNSKSVAEDEAAPISYNFEWAPDVDLLSTEALTRLCGVEAVDQDSRMLHKHGAAQNIRKAEKVLDQSDADDFREKQEKAISDSEDCLTTTALPEHALLTTAREQLRAILPNEIDPSAALKMDNRLKTLWKGRPAVMRSYQSAARYLNILGHKNPHQSIIEINAGSEAAAAVILETLSKKDGDVPRLAKYTVTDPDVAKLDALSQTLSAWHNLVTVKPLDVNFDLKGQEIQVNSFDVVMLPRGLGMVPNKHQTLIAANTLLKPGGRLIILDAVRSGESSLHDFSFGTLPGYSSSSLNDWQHSLQAADFLGLDKCIPTSIEDECNSPFLIVARPTSATAPTKHGILIIYEEGGSGVSIDLLRQLLSGLHLQVDMATWSNAAPAGRLCIVLSELTAPILSSPTSADWERIKQVFLKSAGVLWVVRGGAISCSNPTASLCVGFARTARSELGDSKIVTLDLDPEISTSGEREAITVCEIFRQQLLSEQSSTELEPEFAERNGVLLIPRLVESAYINKTINSFLGISVPEYQPLHQPGRNLHAVLDIARRWETLRFVDHAVPTTLPDDFISVEVRASGITRRDLQTTNSGLGSECSGIVCAVGASVKDFVVGDRVAGIASGSVANFYHDRSSTFQLIPDDMSFAVAASLPLAYCTAYYVVYRLARLMQDEKVLLYGATDPCGYAIIELCHLLGAHIFATVTSESERTMLMDRFNIPDSRVFYGKDDSVVKAVYRETNSRGADVVINVAGADSEQLRLSWRCIAPFGRFISIADGKVPRSSQLDMASFARDATFASFNFFNLLKERRDVAERVWADTMCLVRTKAIKGLSQVTTQYSFSELGKALENLDTASSSGKVVVTADTGVMVEVMPQTPKLELFHPDAAYMLVGGLGGIGRATAIWMIQNGARYLIFVNRSGTSRSEARETVVLLESKGANVKVCACDISDEEQVKEMVGLLSREAPPIRGVIQAAMVLRDNYIARTSLSDYASVLAPKFRGTWNLHTYLPQGRSLDFFVLLSSISGIIGNATQAAYAAGSTFMDSFASYRRSMGLAATSIDLGVIGEVGYLSKNKDLKESMERQGFHVTSLEVLMALIQAAIAGESMCNSQVVTGLGAWRKYHSLSNLDGPLFAHMRRRFLSSNASSSSSTSESQPLATLISACTSLEEVSSIILKGLVHYIATRLSTSDENIDVEKAPAEYGIDSIVAVEVRKWIGKEMGAQVAMLEIVACESLVGLTDLVVGKSKLVKVGEETREN